MAITKPGESQSFAYTGGVQSFTAPYDGLYKLEVWGAKGGDTNGAMGGAGGYSCGYIFLKRGSVININVGAVSNHTSGGSRSFTEMSQSGNGYPGVQYLATGGYCVSILQNEITLIVAGGGGGAGFGTNSKNPNMKYGGGTGGGPSGGNGTGGAKILSTGGTQTSSGQDAVPWNTNGAVYGGAGGGHKRGGNGALHSDRSYYVVSGSGGSGYIGGVPAITYKGVTYSPSTSNGVNSGNGSAKITLMEKSVPTTYYGDLPAEALYYGDFDVTGLFFGDSEVV